MAGHPAFLEVDNTEASHACPEEGEAVHQQVVQLEMLSVAALVPQVVLAPYELAVVGRQQASNHHDKVTLF